MGIFDFFKRPSSAPTTEMRSSVPRVARRSYASAAVAAWHGNFRASGGSADYELSVSMREMRNRIRAMQRNSSTGKRYLVLLKDNIVGPEGFRLRVRVRMTTDPRRLDKTLNERAERAWREFCKSPTVDGQMDMIELQKQMVATWGRDGEYIIEIVYDPAKYENAFALNPIEGDLLDETLNTIYPATGNEIRMGVEVDKDRRPIAYHFLNQHPGDISWSMPFTNKRYRRVPADRVIHIYERLRPGQTRGEPPSSSIPNTVKMLDAYREAEVTGRRVKASAMGFAIKKDDAAAGTGLDGIADRVTENVEFEMDLEPATIKSLPEGYDFKQFDPGGAMTDYAQFEGQIKTDISQGVSISPVSLGYETAKLSYSTHRGIVAEDRDMYRGLQSFFIRMGMNRIFAVFMRNHVTYNPMAEIPPSRLFAILSSATFQPRGWDYIDPAKDVKADNEQLQARTTSLSRVVAKRGIAFSDLVVEIAEDEELLEEYGLTQTFAGGNTSETAKDVEEADDAENSDT